MLIHPVDLTFSVITGKIQTHERIKHRQQPLAIPGTGTHPLSSMATGLLCTWIRGATLIHDLLSLVKSSVGPCPVQHNLPK